MLRLSLQVLIGLAVLLPATALAEDSAFDVVRLALAEPDAEFEARVVELGKRAVVPLLKELQAGSSPFKASRLLGEIGGSKVKRGLKTILGDYAPGTFNNLHVCAAVTLSSLGDTGARRLLAKLLEGDEPRRVLSRVSRVGLPQPRPIMKKLEAFRTSEDAGERLSAYETLGAMPDGTAAWEQARTDDSAEVRLAALVALGDPTGLMEFVADTRQPANLRANAINAITRNGLSEAEAFLCDLVLTAPDDGAARSSLTTRALIALHTHGGAHTLDRIVQGAGQLTLDERALLRSLTGEQSWGASRQAVKAWLEGGGAVLTREQRLLAGLRQPFFMAAEDGSSFALGAYCRLQLDDFRGYELVFDPQLNRLQSVPASRLFKAPEGKDRLAHDLATHFGARYEIDGRTIRILPLKGE